jgi:hypothetical protein
MRRSISLIICLIGTLILVPDFPARAKSVGYNQECQSSSKWKRAKQHRFSMRGKSYKLIESHTPDSKDPRFSHTSFCLVQGDSVKVLKLFKDNDSLSLSSEGNSRELKKVSDGIFTIEFSYDSDVGIIKLYKIDLRNLQNPKVTLLKITSG